MTGQRIPPEIHAQIIILHDEGYSTHQIASRLGLNQKSVCRSINNFLKTGKYGFNKPAGRPKCTTTRMDRSIVMEAKKYPRKSSRAIQAGLPQSYMALSQRTIRRRLVNANLRSYKPAKKPALSPKNITDRLTFCRKYQAWTPEQWNRVMFSDETVVSQFYTFGRHVRRPPKQRYNSRYLVSTTKYSPKVMVWGAISAGGISGLWFMPEGETINGSVYLEVLKSKLPFFMDVRGCTHFQHDGAPCHQTKAVKKWLTDNGIAILGPWPGNSPDLNPIENCWVNLKQKVSMRNPSSISQLLEAIKDVWVKDITPDYCKSLCLSMPNRINAVLHNHGGHIKY